ncbi:GNAT family N-acetyltransferase [Falsarthrobacter nasiphocae]|uniref:GNAT superfamily N-acetyltransferase n=1 Tax=Falsarthrobacter nasiphocae TaxID=189863 RepID=A0AAE4C7A7_9MICC|nr:GNAT family N-acetyltransferase [Falsarthrobacter nasiphocae]MDR6892359.1 GNAT superfamily N-acetyltransferase [Falsarthrobacter nasiphocae]
MDAQEVAQLATAWTQGWALARNYEPAEEGGAIVVTRHDRDGLIEHILVCPAAEDLERHGPEFAGPDRVTIVSTDLPAVLAWAGGTNLSKAPSVETLMSTDMHGHDVEAPTPPGDGIRVQTESPRERVTSVKVYLGEDLAASGSVAVVGNTAVFDAISTEPEFRRRGLASFVMRTLAHEALKDDVETGLLLASPDGLHLYRHLGWDEIASVPVFTPESA